MRVSEKSDRAIVPMNQPNKGEQSSAEVGEGRARTKEVYTQSGREEKRAAVNRLAAAVTSEAGVVVQ